MVARTASTETPPGSFVAGASASGRSCDCGVTRVTPAADRTSPSRSPKAVPLPCSSPSDSQTASPGRAARPPGQRRRQAPRSGAWGDGTRPARRSRTSAAFAGGTTLPSVALATSDHRAVGGLRLDQYLVGGGGHAVPNRRRAPAIVEDQEQRPARRWRAGGGCSVGLGQRQDHQRGEQRGAAGRQPPGRARRRLLARLELEEDAGRREGDARGRGGVSRRSSQISGSAASATSSQGGRKPSGAGSCRWPRRPSSAAASAAAEPRVDSQEPAPAPAGRCDGRAEDQPSLSAKRAHAAATLRHARAVLVAQASGAPRVARPPLRVAEFEPALKGERLLGRIEDLQRWPLRRRRRAPSSAARDLVERVEEVAEHDEIGKAREPVEPAARSPSVRGLRRDRLGDPLGGVARWTLGWKGPSSADTLAAATEQRRRAPASATIGAVELRHAPTAASEVHRRRQVDPQPDRLRGLPFASRARRGGRRAPNGASRSAGRLART